jgi:hypothetical protein
MRLVLCIFYFVSYGAICRKREADAWLQFRDKSFNQEMRASVRAAALAVAWVETRRLGS